MVSSQYSKHCTNIELVEAQYLDRVEDGGQQWATIDPMSQGAQ